MNKTFLKKLLVINFIFKLGAGEAAEDDFSALQKLIKKNHNGRIERLLSKADSCQILDLEGNSLAHVACKYGNLVALKQLKISNVDLKTKNCHGLTPLHYASRSSSLECLKFLLENSCQINEANNYGMTALHFAAKKGDPRCVDYLISKSADLNAQDQRGMTPLHIAASRGWRHVVQSLIRNFSDIEIKDHRDLSAFEIAVEKDHHHIAEDLALAPSKTEFRFDNLSDFNFYVTMQVTLLGEDPQQYVDTLYEQVVNQLETGDEAVKKSVVLEWIHDLFAQKQQQARQRLLAQPQNIDPADSFGVDIGTGARSMQPCFVRAETEAKMRKIGFDPRVHGGDAGGKYATVNILESWRHWRSRMSAADFLQTLAKGDRLLAGVDLPDEEIGEDLQLFLCKADAKQLLKDMGLKSASVRQEMVSGKELWQIMAKKNDSLPQKRGR